MKGNSNGRLNKAGTTRTFRLSPTTRAIRAALAGSTALLALALTGGAAYAGTCATTVADTVTCNGVFTDTLPGIEFAPTVDLTLVLGDSAPTSVTPAVGAVGVDATWGGTIGVINYADITTEDADGVHIYGSTFGAGASLSNYGGIVTNLNASGASAVDISAYGDVTVVNGGSILAYSGGAYDVTSVTAYSVDGVTTIDNLAAGTITATATDGNALAVNAFGFEDTAVNNAGDISSSSVNGSATGVFVEAHAHYETTYIPPFTCGNYTCGGYDTTAEVGGTSSVTNGGNIDVTSEYAQAVGVSAYAGGTSVAIDNAGTISAAGYDLAIGISTYATKTTSIDNAGTINASAVVGNAYGVSAVSDWDSINISNSGDIGAAAYGQAAGIVSTGYRGSIDNSGSVVATSTNGTASGILARDYYSSTISNAVDGAIQATSDLSDAAGVDASTALLAVVDNAGVISASAYYDATGIVASSLFGSEVNNAGSIIANAEHGDAAGVIAEVFGGPYAYYWAQVDNTGNISATSNYGNAIGIQVGADLPLGVVYNSGSVSATSHQGAATGIGVSTSASISSTYVLNDGIVDAVADGDHGLARGIDAYAGDGDAYVITSGSISATAGVSGTAEGVSVLSQNGSATVRNSGDINVVSTPVNVAVFLTDLDYATGIYAGGEDEATVLNAGSISVEGGWQALGIEARADDGLVSVSNGEAGTISVIGSRTASGISTFVDSFLTDPYTNAAVIDNAGSISVLTAGAITDAYGIVLGNSANGINAVLKFGDYVTITNSGSISVGSVSIARGIRADTIGDVLVDNSGSIAITGSGTTSSYGVEGYSISGDVALVNSGDITIQSSNLTNGGVATGLDATARSRDDDAASVVNTGDASVLNTGEITIDGAATAFGIHAEAGLLGTGHVTVSNVGDISVDADSAWGIDTTLARYDGSTLIDNGGTIAVTGLDARGLRIGQGSSVGDVHITNSGDIDATAISPVSSYSYAYGAIGVFARRYAFEDGGVVTVDNSGSINAITEIGDSTAGHRGAHSHGIRVSTYGNDIDVGNAGSIRAELTASGAKGGAALGIFVKNGYGTSYADIGISNTGSIETSVTSNDAFSPYTFLYYSGAYTAGIQALVTYGDADVVNTGSIDANVRSDYNADAGVTRANGISVISKVGSVTREFGLGDLTIANSSTGSISASAQSDYGDGATFATGISALVTVGSYGASLVSLGHGISIDNAGSVSALAVTGAGAVGSASATGISAVNGSDAGFAAITNSGTLVASATTTGTATAIGVLGSAKDVTVALVDGSNIDATATGSNGSAIGLSITGDLVTASNAGSITAEFIGEAGDTYGALIASASGDVTFTNAGAITATDADYAVGVQLSSLTATTLENSGVIAALSTPEGGIAVRTGASKDAITNTGTIVGAVITGDGDDAFDNGYGGVWHTFGSSDFGSGDDTINNAGTIHLSDASITLGSPGALGNTFNNVGLITVLGDNLIDMGALNPLAFTNRGVISFQDGVAGDTLTIVGDFAGDGAINLDVSGLYGTSDQLYVEGSVVDGSVTVINVNVLDLPSTEFTTGISMVQVAGDSTAGAFALGDVNYDPNQSFVTLDFQLLTRIDTTNTSNDVFSLGVSGLSDSGTLAAAIAPGVQSLVGTQIGTWRQRMGVIDKITQGGVNLWARLFQNDGAVNPEHVTHNFGQGGNFAYDQKNSGTEVGVDFAISDGFSLGLLLAKADATQHLNGSGVGSSELDGDTVGGYATWVSPQGFYLDASYRQMSFDAKLRTPSGEIRTSGDANAFNVEAGYAWTLASGLKIEPQVQYTRAQVDSIDSLPGALASYQSSGGDSSLGRVGVALRKTLVNGNTAWTPYATVSLVSEFDGKNGFSINNNFTGETSVEGTSALIEGGLNVQTGNLTVFGGVNWQDGGALEGVAGGQLGVRYTW